MRELKKEYKVNFRGYDLAIPAGRMTDSMTAMGLDTRYNFLTGPSCRKVAKDATGFLDSILLHDLLHYGLNIPEEYLTTRGN